MVQEIPFSRFTVCQKFTKNGYVRVYETFSGIFYQCATCTLLFVQFSSKKHKRKVEEHTSRGSFLPDKSPYERPRPLKELEEPIYFLDTTSNLSLTQKKQEEAIGAVAESEDLLIVHKNELLLHVNINQFFTKVVSIPSQLHTKNCSGGKIDTFWGHTKLKNRTKKLLEIVNFKKLMHFFDVCLATLSLSKCKVLFNKIVFHFCTAALVLRVSLTLICFVIRLKPSCIPLPYSCVSSF